MTGQQVVKTFRYGYNDVYYIITNINKRGDFSIYNCVLTLSPVMKIKQRETDLSKKRT